MEKNIRKLTLREFIEDLKAQGEKQGLMDLAVRGVATMQSSDLNSPTTFIVQLVDDEYYVKDGYNERVREVQAKVQK